MGLLTLASEIDRNGAQVPNAQDPFNQKCLVIDLVIRTVILVVLGQATDAENVSISAVK